MGLVAAVAKYTELCLGDIVAKESKAKQRRPSN